MINSIEFYCGMSREMKALKCSEMCVKTDDMIELTARLRQAEKDAARYRWLKEVARHDCDIDDFFDGSCDRIDAKVDECIEVMQCK